MNLFDYLEHERASFDEKPFSVLDATALALFCMADASKAHSLADFGAPNDPTDEAELGDIEREGRLFAKSPRFSGLAVSDFSAVFEPETHTQFAATTYIYGEEWAYVGFRGTDDSFAGWRENFDIAVAPPIGSEVLGAEYLNAVAGHLPERLFVGGHSKGGNVATYASLYCDEAVQDRIVCIYDFDGPGFKPDLMSEQDFEPIAGRVVRLVPEEDVVGQLLDTSVPTRYVKSSAEAMGQHSPFTWLLNDELSDFLYADSLADSSRLTHEMMDEWLSTLEDDQWSVIIDTMFQIIENTGVSGMNEFLAGNSTIADLVNKVVRNVNSQTRSIIMPALTRFIRVNIRVNLRDWRRRHHGDDTD